MLLTNLSITAALAISRGPGFIVGPIAKFLGIIYNMLFNFLYGFLENNALGVAIVLFTILIKAVLTPLLYKQQSSSFKMMSIQPEINKIKAKYADKKDPQSQQKMAYEMQKIQKENGISVMGGCLPLLIQLPILYALFYIFQQPYNYVDILGQGYAHIADLILQIPAETRVGALYDIALSKKTAMDLAVHSDIVLLINSMTNAEWTQFFGSIGSFADTIKPVVDGTIGVQKFLGLNLSFRPGYAFPGILLPIVSGATTWFSSRILMANQPKPDKNNPTASMMSSMNIFMPIMMTVMTFTVPVGLGIYWISSNIIQIVQSLVITRILKKKQQQSGKGA